MRCVAVILTIVLILAIMPLTALADINISGYYFYENNGDGTCVIIDYVGPGGDVIIPSSLAGLTVTEIGDWSFEDDYTIIGVTIPSSVISIGNSAFRNCTSLDEVNIPNGVQSIGDYAFKNCYSLTNVTISNSVNTIGTKAFDWCTSLISITVSESNLNYKSIDGVLFSKDGTVLIQYPAGNSRTTYTVPTGVIQIDEAFGHCNNLTSITIPSSVSDIGYYGFSYCIYLTNIAVSESNLNYKSIDGVLFSKDGTVLIQYPAGNSRTTYTVPTGVIQIDEAFGYCFNLTSVTIPSGVYFISSYAFMYCDNLTSIYISDSVANIGTDAFAGCHEDLIVYGPLGCYAETYCDANGITYYGYTDAYGPGVMGRTYERPDGSVYSITYFNGSTCADPKIQADYYDEAGIMFFTEQFGADGSIVASIWFHPSTIIPSVKNYYDHGTLYFQEEYDGSGTMIASISYHADGVSRYFKNYYNSGVMYFQEEYNTSGTMIASIWFQADGVTRHFKNYYNGYLYFQEEYNTSGTMIASINFREDGVTRERKCYYRESDGALYLIEYYDTNGDLIDSEWF